MDKFLTLIISACIAWGCGDNTLLPDATSLNDAASCETVIECLVIAPVDQDEFLLPAPVLIGEGGVGAQWFEAFGLVRSIGDSSQGWAWLPITAERTLVSVTVYLEIAADTEAVIGITERDLTTQDPEIVLAIQRFDVAPDDRPYGPVRLTVDATIQPGHGYLIELICNGPCTYGGATIVTTP